jgi:hypothetical protein
MDLEASGWVVLGTSFLCRGLPAEERRTLEALLRGFPRLAFPAGAVEIRVAPGSFLLTDGEGTHWDLSDSAAPLSAHVEYRLINEAIRRAAGRWVLHAGAVATRRGTCLVLGGSGAGKTSLTLWLWASGFRLVTDDLCPLDRGSLAPEVFPRALHMDGEYSPRLLQKIPPRPLSYPADYYPFPAASGEELPPVSDLIVLERGPDPDGELLPLGRSEAVHHLVRAVLKSPGFDFPTALASMVRLSGWCRAHRLRSGTPEGAAARALELLAGD